jgi:hypothetical protein
MTEIQTDDARARAKAERDARAITHGPVLTPEAEHLKRIAEKTPLEQTYGHGGAPRITKQSEAWRAPLPPACSQTSELAPRKDPDEQATRIPYR